MVNIEETEDAYHLEAELPGVKKEDVEVNVKDDYLVIKGEKKSFNEEKKDQYHRVERSHGSFYRTIALPGDIDKENIHAELKDGVLVVDIKKAENTSANERKITIQ
jgi:HSP20 family protein